MKELSSNILIVQRNAPFRICRDPVPLNKASKPQRLQFTTIDKILPELDNVKIFSCKDAKKGVWQVKPNEDSNKGTTLWIPFGSYRWLRVPFGISPVPEIFQIKLDDIVISGCEDSLEEAMLDHNHNLENLFDRLRQNNFKPNRTKLKLYQKSIKFYGHDLTDEGLKADNIKIFSIINYPTPTNKKNSYIY